MVHIEALWALHYFDGGAETSSGTVTMLNGRLFGGDSFFFYLGRYKLRDARLEGEARIRHYNGQNWTAFGMRAEKPLRIRFEGEAREDEIAGTLSLLGPVPDHARDSLPFVLRRLQALPGSVPGGRHGFPCSDDRPRTLGA